MPGRALAQGGSVYSTGAKSAYYNPANLTSSGLVSADMIYINYLPNLADDISFKSFYLSGNFEKWGYWGIAYNRLSFGEPTRDNYGLPYDFHEYEYALTLYSAYKLDPDMSIGVGFKYIDRHMSDLVAGRGLSIGVGSAFAFDLGIQLRRKFINTTIMTDSDLGGGMAFGFSILNLGPDIKYEGGDLSDRLSRRLLIGVGYQPIKIKNYELNLTLDASHLLVDLNDGFSTEWKEFIWSYGLEAEFYDMFAFRVGRYNDQAGVRRYWAGGLSIGPDWLHVDYSYAFKSSERWNRIGGEYAIGLAANLFGLPFGKGN
jgi:hypothetical protein